MKITKDQIHNIFNFIVANAACSLFQIFVLVCIYFLQFLIWFISGGILYFIFGDFKWLSIIPLIISYAAIIVLYGIIWFSFWSRLFKDGIKWFYCRVIFSIIPLILLILMFNPTPDPLAMITEPLEPVFSCLVTGVILLPIYSVIIYKAFLQHKTHKKRNKTWLFLVMILLGSLIFIASWNLMHVIYK